MRVQLISDTHGKHHEMSIDETVDVIIHAGDSTNYYDIVNNEVEFENFLSWYSGLNIKHKILIKNNLSTIKNQRTYPGHALDTDKISIRFSACIWTGKNRNDV